MTFFMIEQAFQISIHFSKLKSLIIMCSMSFNIKIPISCQCLIHQQQGCIFLQTDIGTVVKPKMIQWPVGKEAQRDDSSSLAIYR